MALDPVKLQAQLHKLQSQYDEAMREKEAMSKDLARIKDQNRRGDAELRKAEAIILKSRDAQQVALLMDERDTYMQQVKAIQELLRENAEELEKYKKLVREGGESAAPSGASAARPESVQERLSLTRTHVKDAERRLADATAALEAAQKAVAEAAPEAPAAASTAAVSTAEAEVAAAQAALSELRPQLAALEEEAEAGASEAVRQTRAREKLEREQKEKISSLESALEAKIREVAGLSEAASNAEAAHARDLENLLAKLNEREAETMGVRAELKAAMDSIEAFKAQIEDTRRKADEEQRKAVEKALEKARKEKGTVDEAAHTELTRKLDAAQAVVKQLTEANAELQREKDAADADVKATREKLIKREQKLTLAVQERAEAESKCGDLQTEIAAVRKRNEKLKKDNKTAEDSNKMCRAEIERLGLDLRKLSDAKVAVDEALATTRASLSSLTAEHTTAVAELESSKAQCATYGDAVVKLEAAVAAAEARMEEMRGEHSISVRLIKQMNRELKIQLAAEVRRVAKLERDLAAQATNKGTPQTQQLQRAQSMMPTTHPASNKPGPQSPVPTAGAPSSGSTGSAAPGFSPGVPVKGAPVRGQAAPVPPGTASPLSAVSSVVSRTFRADSSIATPPGPPGAARAPVLSKGPQGRPTSGSVANMGGSDMEETVRMLGSRLQAVLGEAEVAKEKVRMLETIIQDLTRELDEKKRLLKSLTTSKSGGEDEGAGLQRAIQAAAASDNPVQVLQSLLEKTMSENTRLKRDMKILGEELSTAQEQLSRSAAETAASRSMAPDDVVQQEVYDQRGDSADAGELGIEDSRGMTPGTESSPGLGNSFGSSAAEPVRIVRGNPF